MDKILFTSPALLFAAMILNIYFSALLLTMMNASGNGLAILMWKVPAVLAMIVAAATIAQLV